MVDVRGRGLMVGVEFGGKDSSNRLKAEKGVAMVGDARPQQLKTQQWHEYDVVKPCVTFECSCRMRTGVQRVARSKAVAGTSKSLHQHMSA